MDLINPFSTAVYPYRLYFGKGGVDDAEDADVIVHEYGHAILHKTAPTSSKNTERKCIEEAICDYFAVSYSQQKSAFNATKVFNWDGHNEFWPGRVVSSGKNYQNASFKNGNYYAHTDLFASVLLQIQNRLGRSSTDQLVIEASYFLTSNTTMRQFGQYMLLSDSLLNGAGNIRAISEAFYNRSILSQVIANPEFSLTDVHIQVSNTLGFARGEELRISYQGGLHSYALYNLNGQQLESKELGEVRTTLLSSQSLAPGIYILKVNAADGRKTSLKLTRFHP
ncbi:MAG: T9SS type A sorting domain-containing protein [Owenweeksia sp.]|nr:T9SS type A sorting domain-containing protein [Owenweeksia sp.]